MQETLTDLEARALDLRIGIGRWGQRITDAAKARDERLTVLPADDLQSRRDVAENYGRDISTLEASRREAESLLAETEAAIAEARKAPRRERRNKDREPVAALLARHNKARLDVQGFGDRLLASIVEINAVEIELAEYQLTDLAPNALRAGGLRHRLESIGWLLRDWLRIPGASFAPPNHHQSVKVPFEERCRRTLIDLEFIDEEGRPK